MGNGFVESRRDNGAVLTQHKSNIHTSNMQNPSITFKIFFHEKCKNLRMTVIGVELRSALCVCSLMSEP